MMWDMDPEIEEVVALTDPMERARRANEVVTRLQSSVNEAARVRREAIEELIGQGVKQANIARILGVSRSRISRLLSSAPNIERALLGTGPVTIAVGGKWEAQKAAPSAVVSTQALAAATLIGNMCRDYGLDLASDYEVIPPPGMVHLNRENLIVLTSPRLLPLVGQVLDADEHLGFGHSAQGWFLVDHDSGTEYRSPASNGESRDYGYIGRLPRPDGRGTFLYLAGIHAMGTLGTAQYLADNIVDLYRQVKTNRWSVLVEIHYDPDTLVVRSAERITPIHVTRP